MNVLTRISIAIAAGATGCASQAAPDYQGEPLLTMSGTIVNQLETVPANTEVVLDFVVTGMPHGKYWTTVPTVGDFPAAFTLDIYTPPPADLLFAFLDGSNRIAEAVLYVVQTDDDGQPIATIGQLANHKLIYAAGPVAADSPLGRDLGSLGAGYHLFEQVLPAPTDDELATCTAKLTNATCTAADAAAYCAANGAAFASNGATLTELEVPPSTPLVIALDDLPCGPGIPGI